MATEPIPQIDLASLHTALRADIDASIRAVIDAGSFVLGETLARFEQACADYLGVPHAIGVASGTDALLIALRAAGIGQGDEVITSAFSFFGSVEAILHAGATPVFADIEAGSMTLDAEDVARKITRRTRAIMPVHMFGQIGEIDSLLELAEAHDLVVIEDAAQAFGARFNGRLAGSFGHAGCFSFHPAKPLGALGDGGMLVTVDEALAAEARRLRDHGSRARYDHVSVGYNSRLDALQAAVLEVKLRHLEAHLAERERLARRYRELLSGTALVLPETLPERRHVFAQFTVRSERRDNVCEAMRARGIGCAVHYPQPLYRQAAIAERYGDVKLEVTEAVCESCLSLPLFQGLTEEQQQRVADVLMEACA